MVFMKVELERQVGGLNPNGFIETLTEVIIATGCLWIWNKIHFLTSEALTRVGRHSLLWLCKQKYECIWFYRHERLKCKTKYELNIIRRPLKAIRGGFSTFKTSPRRVVGHVKAERAGKMQNKKKKLLSQYLWLKMAKRCFIFLPYYKPIVEIHRGCEKGTL